MINILTNRYMIDDEWCFNEFKKYIKNDHKIVIIPFSFRNEEIYSNETWQKSYSKESGLYYHGIVNSFKRYEVNIDKISWINYFTDSIEDTKDKVKDADVLYFTGGLPDLMMDRLKEFDLLDLIENHNGVILGFSAGAMIQLQKYHITPDGDYKCFSYYKGLKLIENLNIEVHFSNSDIQLESISRVIKETKNPVYAIEEEGAIIVSKGEVTSVGKVHYFE